MYTSSPDICNVSVRDKGQGPCTNQVKAADHSATTAVNIGVTFLGSGHSFHIEFFSFWSFIYIYERPILISRLNLKKFKCWKCAHICKLDGNAHIFTENVRIFLKMHTFYANENAHILQKMHAFYWKCGKCVHFVRKTLPSRVTFIFFFLDVALFNPQTEMWFCGFCGFWTEIHGFWRKG